MWYNDTEIIMHRKESIMVIGDSELKVMKILWENNSNPMEAKQVSVIANEQYGWNKNTTYTLLKRCIEKGVVTREDPGFVCTPLITKEEVQKVEVERLMERVFDGNPKQLFTVLMEKEGITPDKTEILIQLIQKLKN